MSIPAGGPKARSMAVMAGIWNVMMLSVTTALIIGGFEFPFALLFVPFATLFVVIGFFLAGAWASLQFTRSNVLITPNSVAHQRILLGFKSLEQTDLDTESAARLVEAYSENDKAVFRIQIDGVQHTPGFGTALTRQDQDWVVDSINSFLGRQPDDRVIRQSDDDEDTGTEVAFVTVDPEDLPADSRVQVTKPSPGVMVMTTPAAPPGAPKLCALALVMFVLLLWGGIAIARLLTAGGTLDQVAGWAFAVLAVAPLVCLAVLQFGALTVHIDDREFLCRIHIGPLGYSVRRPAQSAERIYVESTSADPSHATLAAAIVQVSTSKMLCAWGPTAFCQTVAGLVRHHLTELGIETTDGTPLPDEADDPE